MLVHPRVTVEPHRQLLRKSGVGEGVGARPQRPDEQLRRDQLAGLDVDQRDPVAKVDEALLPAAVHLAQHHRELLLEAPVQVAELRVLVPIRLLGLVLLPQQGEGHVMIPPGKLGADLAPVRLRARPPLLELQFLLGRKDLSLEINHVASPATSGQSLRPATWARLRQSETAVLLYPLHPTSCASWCRLVTPPAQSARHAGGMVSAVIRESHPSSTAARINGAGRARSRESALRSRQETRCAEYAPI